MIKGSESRIKKIFLSLLILSGLTVSIFSQDKHIGGVVNVYKHVESIGASQDRVVIDNVASISSGDTVLIIQMKGVIINIPETGTYGTVQDTVGAPGSSEFLIVLSVDGGTRTVVFRNNLLKTYNTSGDVQLIKVPFYNSAVVQSELTCQPWDSISKTGGVLALIVGNTLSLNANIDVTGKGFAGGTPFLGQGLCINDNSLLYDKFSYPDSYLNSGSKGESPAIRAFISAFDKPSLFPDYAKGKGANFTSGGGGNGKFSGGGGGSNYGAGGKGGRENPSACTPNDGGIGGKQVKFTDVAGGLLMGGGGGASTRDPASIATFGGKGGGIIIILCDTVKGNGHNIKAEGATTAKATGNAGSGGGGGGGSIALYQQSFSPLLTSALTITANGGKGGNNAGIFGEGGGGGGGLILTNNIPLPTNVSKTTLGGAVGTRSGGSTGTAGAIGENLTSFIPALNGFLFNSIRSSVTGNLVDSVCSNIMLPVITGTKPVGGTEPYTYLWEKSYDGVAWIPLVNDVDPTNYTPTALEVGHATVWFRRTITDSSTPLALVDVSKPVMIIVQPEITGNLVGKDTTICFNQNPLGLIPLNAGPSNGSSFNYFNYTWIQNLTNTNWTTSAPAAGIATTAGYDPPSLAATTYYQRVVTSGRCISYSSTVTITVLPSITSNTITTPDLVICEGALFNSLAATSPGGGNLAYQYQWQDSVVSSVWNPAAGINTTGNSYIPDTSTFAVIEQHYIRRVVYSGPDSVCQDRSPHISLTRYHKIKNNLVVEADQTICSGSIPLSWTGSVPIQGDGTYTYLWQDSTKSTTWITQGTVGSGYSPSALTDTTWYRRVVYSGVYNSAPVCINVSPAKRINVHKPVLNNLISATGGGVEDTICTGLVPVLLQGVAATGGNNVFAYQWRLSTDNSTFNPVPTGGTGLSYQPPALTTTTYYKRQVTSGACFVTSAATITVTVLQPITGNTISAAKPAVCFDIAPDPITGGNLAEGAGPGTYIYLWEQSSNGGTTWTAASGTNTTANYQPPVLKIPMKYRRTVKSGVFNCTSISSSPVDIAINPLPSSIINAGPDVPGYYSIEKIFHMNADPVLTGESGSWSVSGNGTGSIVDFSNNKAVVRNLSVGNNTFIWTITNGLCNIDDTVSITLLEDFIPQGFSPNGDAWNNTFIVEGLNLTDQEVEMKVVNGAGTQVFSTSNRQGQTWTDWDGKNSRGFDLPEGTYYYLLKVTSKDGQVFKKSGFIVLKRY